MYEGYGTVFDGKGSWSFDSDFARKVLIFGVDSNWSSHADNRKNNFLMLGEKPTDNINGSVVAARKSLVLILVKQRKNFA